MDIKKTLRELLEITPEVMKKAVTEQQDEFNFLMFNTTIPQLKNLLTLLDSANPCKEYQLAIMDAESMLSHIQNLMDNGPTERMSETPLEESQDPDEDDLGEEEEEFEYADDNTNTNEEEDDADANT